jgi:hypothetical protein
VRWYTKQTVRGRGTWQAPPLRKLLGSGICTFFSFLSGISSKGGTGAPRPFLVLPPGGGAARGWAERDWAGCQKRETIQLQPSEVTLDNCNFESNLKTLSSLRLPLSFSDPRGVGSRGKMGGSRDASRSNGWIVSMQSRP